MASTHFTVYPSKKKVTASKIRPRSRRVYAAEGDFDLGMNDTDEAFADQLDSVADNIEDIQDSVDDIEEDDVDIDIDNNISGHYIAECDKCKGIFISATVKSDQAISSVSGVCPLCQEESNQYLKWYIVPNDEDPEDDETMETESSPIPSGEDSNVNQPSSSGNL